MTKEQFIERHNALLNQIEELCKEYIATNIKYAEGTKVKVTNQKGKSRLGVVTDQVIIEDEVFPMVMQLTLSGEVSLRRILVGPTDKVEVLD